MLNADKKHRWEKRANGLSITATVCHWIAEAIVYSVPLVCRPANHSRSLWILALCSLWVHSLLCLNWIVIRILWFHFVYLYFYSVCNVKSIKFNFSLDSLSVMRWCGWCNNIMLFEIAFYFKRYTYWFIHSIFHHHPSFKI